MENKTIDYDQMIRLFGNNGFELSDPPTKSFIYETEDGFKMEFAIQWDLDKNMLYDLARMRKVLTQMVNNVEHEHAKYVKMNDKTFVETLSKELTDYGMESLGDDAFAYKENDQYIFGVDLDYIVSLLVINTNETVKSILDQMKDDAKKGDDHGQKTQD